MNVNHQIEKDLASEGIIIGMLFLTGYASLAIRLITSFRSSDKCTGSPETGQRNR
jgi:hypothetical protein